MEVLTVRRNTTFCIISARLLLLCCRVAPHTHPTLCSSTGQLRLLLQFVRHACTLRIHWLAGPGHAVTQCDVAAAVPAAVVSAC
jgi:hypothetical protein